MRTEVINTARDLLLIGDDVSDQEVAEFITQNKYENQIELYLAVKEIEEFRMIFLERIEPVVKAVSEAYGRLTGDNDGVDTKGLERLGKDYSLAFDSFAAEMSKLVPIVAKSIKDVQSSFADARMTLHYHDYKFSESLFVYAPEPVKLADIYICLGCHKLDIRDARWTFDR